MNLDLEGKHSHRILPYKIITIFKKNGYNLKNGFLEKLNFKNYFIVLFDLILVFI